MNHNMSQINQILEKLSRIDYIKPGEIPNIELYMDQVTTFMDSHLAHSKRYEDDKILTKTMINNYAKNKLLPPPAKKKYTKDHMLLLIFIYYFKSFLSINDIQALLAPVCDRYFGGKDGSSLEDVYEEVFSMKKEQLNALVQDVKQKFETADDTTRTFISGGMYENVNHILHITQYIIGAPAHNHARLFTREFVHVLTLGLVYAVGPRYRVANP